MSKLSPAEIATIKSLKKEGKTYNEIRSKTARSLTSIRKALAEGRPKKKTKAYTWTAPNGVSLKQVLAWYAEDKTLDWIGKQCAKLSREAIRQVIQRAGGKPRGNGYNKHRHKDRVATILLLKDDILAAADKGGSMHKLCKKFKATKHTLCTAIPELEALTRANLRRSRFEPKAVSALWLEGKSLEEIAKSYRSTKGTIGALIQKLRKRHGEIMFPRRRAQSVIVVED